jgi:hypothetical protein
MTCPKYKNKTILTRCKNTCHIERLKSECQVKSKSAINGQL